MAYHQTRHATNTKYSISIFPILIFLTCNGIRLIRILRTQVKTFYDYYYYSRTTQQRLMNFSMLHCRVNNAKEYERLADQQNETKTITYTRFSYVVAPKQKQYTKNKPSKQIKDKS